MYRSPRSADGFGRSLTMTRVSLGTQRAMLRAVAWYRDLAPGRPSPCRFFPSCSEYAEIAIHTHGPWRGGWLTVRRLGRCRPFGPSGFDPVPSRADDVTGS